MAWPAFDLGQVLNQLIAGGITLTAVLLAAKYALSQLRRERALDRRLNATDTLLAAIDDYRKGWAFLEIHETRRSGKPVDASIAAARLVENRELMVKLHHLYECERRAKTLGVQGLESHVERDPNAMLLELNSLLTAAGGERERIISVLALRSHQLLQDSALVNESMRSDLDIGNVLTRWLARRRIRRGIEDVRFVENTITKVSDRSAPDADEISDKPTP